MSITEARIEAAWQEAQVAFRAMIDAKVYGDPNAAETRAYNILERHLDNLLVDAQFDERVAQAEAVIAGDHYIYPAGIGR